MSQPVRLSRHGARRARWVLSALCLSLSALTSVRPAAGSDPRERLRDVV